MSLYVCSEGVCEGMTNLLSSSKLPMAVASVCRTFDLLLVKADQTVCLHSCFLVDFIPVGDLHLNIILINVWLYCHLNVFSSAQNCGVCC